MIEFIISKLWALLCGMIVIGAILHSFTSLNQSTSEKLLNKAAEKFYDILSEVSLLEKGSIIELKLREILPSRESKLILFKNHFCIESDSTRKYIILNKVTISKNVPLNCTWGQTLIIHVIERGNLSVHLEKIEMSFLNEEQNLLHSSIVLYMYKDALTDPSIFLRLKNGCTQCIPDLTRMPSISSRIIATS